MSHNHPSRTYKGCAMCKPQKHRGRGRSEREPFAVRRKIGKSKRLSRADVGD